MTSNPVLSGGRGDIWMTGITPVKFCLRKYHLLVRIVWVGKTDANHGIVDKVVVL
jgi:hypothetical protein